MYVIPELARVLWNGGTVHGRRVGRHAAGIDPQAFAANRRYGAVRKRYVVTEDLFPSTGQIAPPDMMLHVDASSGGSECVIQALKLRTFCRLIQEIRAD